MSIRTGDPAPDLHGLAEGERQVSLAEWWIDRPVVAIFLRHFG